MLKLNYLKILVLISIFFFSLSSVYSIEERGLSSPGKIILTNQNPLIKSAENKIYSTYTFKNETYVYDIQLASSLKEAKIEFSQQDLIDYSNVTHVPLLLKYERPIFTGIPIISAVITDYLGIPLVRTDKKIIDDVKSSVSSVGGEFKITYKSIEYIAVDPPVSRLKEFTSKLPKEVKKIYVDSKAKIMLNDSIQIIKNPAKKFDSEAKYGILDGSDIKIAIIDTGIDKTHPDLDDLDDDPNTFDSKVIAEKCFCSAVPGERSNCCPNGQSIENNARDGNGHGTHVASIAAGTGQASNYKFVGVAPKTQLIAIKVLDDDGSGLFSDIIAGIEWAEDNGADIISMSLGCGPNCRNQPMEDAVRQAITKGVVVVVAAGNSGNSWSTISTPGLVEEAITVGATDKNDILAEFSSRGPTDDLLIKPDVLTPGVKICAARVIGGKIDQNIQESGRQSEFLICDNDKYFALSGTSMATPHVSGAIALIKQAHHDWTPEQIKSALVNTAKDLNYNIYEQGAGRIDVYDFLNPLITLSPSVLNMGLIKDEEISNFSIKNVDAIKYGVSIGNISIKNLEGSFNYNLDIKSSKNDFCIDTNNIENITFTINTSSLPFDSYSGHLSVYLYPNCDFTGETRFMSISVGFSKLKKVIININSSQRFSPTEEKLYDALLYDGNYIFDRKISDKTNITFLTKHNYFDVILGLYTLEDNYGSTSAHRATYMVKGVDLKNADEAQLFFDESDAQVIKTNIEQLFDSKSLVNYYKKITFSPIASFTIAGYEGGYWEAAVNTNNNLFTNYELRLGINAHEKNVILEESKTRMSVPALFTYPFNNLEQNIPESELRKINITFSEFAKYPGSYFWDVVVDGYGGGIYDTLSNLPKNFTYFIRDIEPFHYWSEGGYYNENVWLAWELYNPVFQEKGRLEDSVSVLEKPFKLVLGTTPEIKGRCFLLSPAPGRLMGLMQDRYGKTPEQEMICPYRNINGTLSIKTPEGVVHQFEGGQYWDIYCPYPPDSTTKIECSKGDYLINWKINDLIKDQDLFLNTMVNWDGEKWTNIGAIQTLFCSTPGSTTCLVNTDCQCSISNCNSGWIRGRLPDNSEFTKYFTSTSAFIVNSGSKSGTVNSYISCNDNKKEYPISFQIV